MKIICSAIKFGNGAVIRGHRHNDCIRTASGIMTISRQDIINRVEGFMTGENKFVDRKEAKKITLKSTQLVRSYDKKLLYSEDLY